MKKILSILAIGFFLVPVFYAPAFALTPILKENPGVDVTLGATLAHRQQFSKAKNKSWEEATLSEQRQFLQNASRLTPRPTPVVKEKSTAHKSIFKNQKAVRKTASQVRQLSFKDMWRSAQRLTPGSSSIAGPKTDFRNPAFTKRLKTLKEVKGIRRGRRFTTGAILPDASRMSDRLRQSFKLPRNQFRDMKNNSRISSRISAARNRRVLARNFSINRSSGVLQTISKLHASRRSFNRR